MTKRERVYSAIKHKNTDTVPYHLTFTSDGYENVVSYFKDRDIINKIGNHLSVQWYSTSKVEIMPDTGFFKDDFGVLWDKSGPEHDIGVVAGILLKEPTMKGFTMPQVNEKEWRSTLESLVNNKEDTFKIAALGFALYDRAWTFRGMENFLMDMVMEPAFVEELLEAITEFNLKLIDIALEYDIDAFHFADDWGQQRGLVMGPEFWRKYLKKGTARMYERVKSKGKIVSQHACGDNYEIFPDLVEIGLDIYQTLQPEIYDLPKVKREFGKDLSFWGGISTQRLLPFGTPDEVREVVKATLKLMGNGGGYIAGPTHDIVGGMPPENIAAFIKVLQDQGK